jgi:hypothetical protein
MSTFFKVSSHSGDLDLDGRAILQRIVEEWGGVLGTGFKWLRIGSRDGLL